MFETATTPQRCMLVTLMVFSIGCGPATPPEPTARSPVSPAADEGATQPVATSLSNDPLAATSQSADTTEVVYTCPMHPQVRQGAPGRCPVCGMDLVVAEPDSAAVPPTENDAHDHGSHGHAH